MAWKRKPTYVSDRDRQNKGAQTTKATSRRERDNKEGFREEHHRKL